MVDAAGTTAYAYTIAGRLFTEDGPWASDTVTNYYNNGLRTNLVLAQPTGKWTNGFAYDAAKRLTSVTSPAGTFTYTLGAMGGASPLIQKIALPNSSYITNAYDTVARLRFTKLLTSSSSLLDSAQYGYNAGNQRVTFTNAAGTWFTNRYDSIGQLTVADSSTASEDRGYTYDTAWNLNYRTNNGALSTFKVDPKNQLTNVTVIGTQTYDDNGNLTWAMARGYSYDDENRLQNWYYYDDGNDGNGSPTSSADLRTEFVYDGTGRLRKRVEYVVTGSNPYVWTVDDETRYVYDGMRVIQERSDANRSTVSYTRGTDLSGSLEGAGGIGGLLARSHGYSIGNGSWSTHNAYHADGNGNITYLVNSSQTLAASYRYDPFGNTTTSSGSLASANVYRFSSKEIHVKSGLYYYGYRFYSPSLQRWLNRDPIGEKGGKNLYRFVRNSPASNFDALGLEESWPGEMPPIPYRPNPGPSAGNCWRYACGDPGKPNELHDPVLPGWTLKPPGQDKDGKKSCPEMMKSLQAAGATAPPCGAGTHKITIQYADSVEGPGGLQRDYHFSREFPDGTWGDKRGKSCSRGLTGPDDIPPGYTKCGELCVPDGWDTDKIPADPTPRPNVVR